MVSTKHEFKSICSVARCPVPPIDAYQTHPPFLSLACGCAGWSAQLRSARFLALHQPTAVLLSVLFTCEDRGTALPSRPPASIPTARTLPALDITVSQGQPPSCP